MPVIERSILIQARIGQVWDVLTIPRLIAQWANTFQPGMYAESAWLTGCEVHWKQADGATVLTGRVVEASRGKLLKIAFTSDLNPEMPAGSAALEETYRLESGEDGVRLSITCGPMPPREHELLFGPWGKALEDIKALAEAGGAAQMRPRPGAAPRSAA